MGRRLRRIPLCTWVLVATCVVWTWPSLPGGEGLVHLGAVTRRSLWDGQYWRLFASTFLHDGWLHLGSNALSLLFVGTPIERGVGWKQLLFFLLISAAGGFAASFLFTAAGPGDLDAPRIGISGGLFGLLGQILAIEASTSPTFAEFRRRRNVKLVALLFVFNLGLGLSLNLGHGILIDNSAHIGGFLTGLAVGLVFYGSHRFRPIPATAAAFVLAGLPLLYAAHPFLDPAYHLERSRLALARHDRGAAIRELSTVLQLDPNNALAKEKKSQLEDRQEAKNRWKVARRTLQATLTGTAPPAPERLIRLATEAAQGLQKAKDPDAFWGELADAALRASRALDAEASPAPAAARAASALLVLLVNNRRGEPPATGRLLAWSGIWLARGAPKEKVTAKARLRDAARMAQTSGDAATVGLAREWLKRLG